MIGGAAQEPGLHREPDLQVPGLHHHGRVEIGRRRRSLRLRGEEMAGVVMLRVGEDFLGRAGLDDLAAVHDADPVGDLAHDAEVVGNEQHGHAALLLLHLQQFEDLRLHGDVERRRRLVGDEKVRLVGERHRDHHALPLAAGELVRIGAEALFRIADADLMQQLERAPVRLLVGDAAVDLQDLADLPLDRVQRVQRRHRLLEDHRDLVAADLSKVALVVVDEVLAAIEHRAAGMAGGRIGQELQDRQRRDRLARAALADQRQRLALVDVEGDVVDGERGAAVLVEGDLQPLDGEERAFRQFRPGRGDRRGGMCGRCGPGGGGWRGGSAHERAPSGRLGWFWRSALWRGDAPAPGPAGSDPCSRGWSWA